MKLINLFTVLTVAVVILLFQGSPIHAESMGTAFTYQGRLIDGEHVADRSHDFQFKLFDSVEDGNQIGSDVNIPGVDVIEGYFTVALDFGSDVFDGDARWLQIGVRPSDLNDLNEYTVLSPRPEVTAAPYALHTRGIFVDGFGNVAIGGTEPWYPLDVYKAVPDGWLAGFHNLSTDGTAHGIIAKAYGGAPLLVQSATEDVLHVGQNGYIGIGTTSPNQKLEVDYGNLLVQGTGGFITTGDEAFVYLGDINHYIKSAWDFGVGIGTQGAHPAMVIRETTGNVGIGITEPQMKLAVRATRPQIALSDYNGDTGVIEFHEETNQLRFQYWTDYGDTWVQTMMALDGATGRVGIGTTDPKHMLHVQGVGSNFISRFDNVNSSGDSYGIEAFVDSYGSSSGNATAAYFYGRGGSTSGSAKGVSSNVLAFGSDEAYGVYSHATGGMTTGREWAFFGIGDGYFSGNLSLGTENTGYRLRVLGDIAYTGDLVDLSDLRLKENIAPLENAMEKVSKLNAIYFNNKGEGEYNREIGVIAQDVKKVLPEIVSTDNEGYMSVDYTKLSAVLIEAVKEQQKQIDLLKTEISTLKSKMKAEY